MIQRAAQAGRPLPVPQGLVASGCSSATDKMAAARRPARPGRPLANAAAAAQAHWQTGASSITVTMAEMDGAG